MKYVTVSTILEQAVRAKMEATLDTCRKHYQKDIPTPLLRFKQLGRTAGIYHYRRANDRPTHSEIRINPDFFKNYYDDMLNDTVPHEVAHYVSVFLFGHNEGGGHGWRWREVMRVIGIRAADRCHQYALDGVAIRRGSEANFKYTCRCDGGEHEHWLSKRVHARHQSALVMGGKGYRCKQCRTNLVYKGFKHGDAFVPAAPTVTQLPPVKLNPSVAAMLPKIAVTPRPEPKPVVPDSGFRTVTRFINGVLTNIKVPVSQAA